MKTSTPVTKLVQKQVASSDEESENAETENNNNQDATEADTSLPGKPNGNPGRHFFCDVRGND